MNMVPQLRSLDNSTLANKDMISDLERVERVRAAVESAGWSQDRAFGYVAVSSHVYGDAGRVGCWCAGVGWVCAGAEEVAADHGFGLDYRLAAEDDVLGAVDLGTSGDLVACVLGLVSSVLWIVYGGGWRGGTYCFYVFAFCSFWWRHFEDLKGFNRREKLQLRR